jgi:1-acyl-sn-glycerol-3-phosphate acyltransferase
MLSGESQPGTAPSLTVPSCLSANLSFWWYEATYWAAMTGMCLGFSLRIEGRRHVPRTGPALLIANHQSYLDPVLVGLASRRRLVYLSRKSLFSHPLFARLIRSYNAVPIDQEGIGIEGLRRVTQQLHEGRAVIVYPEGERSPDGKIHALKPGIHLLLKRTPVPVVPVGIAGAYDAWPRSRSWPVPAPLFLPAGKATLAVSVGRPLDARKFVDWPRERVLATLLDELQVHHARAERLRRKFL